MEKEDQRHALTAKRYKSKRPKQVKPCKFCPNKIGKKESNSDSNPADIPLVSPPSRFRARTPTSTARITTTLFQPLLRRVTKFPIQFRTWILSMNEIAESTTNTAFTTIKSTTSFSEIRHG